VAKRAKSINLALQGGGAHGAFTWGVLDRLLEDERLSFGWVSATSAGAINAVALACGLAEGGREAARARLKSVWQAIEQAGVPDFVRNNPFLYGLSRSPALTQIAGLWSPYDFNPLNFDPLRDLLTAQIDFARLRKSAPVELLIAATEVATGRARLFRRHEITVDMVLASACLPTLHHAVEIAGRAYWDGGFSANPDLVTLARESRVRDTLIVKLAPLTAHEVPRRAIEINGHVNRLMFNAPLLRDVEIIEAERQEAKGGWWGWRNSPLVRHRFHLIDAARYTGALSPASQGQPDGPLLGYLYNTGRDEAAKWLRQNRVWVGRRSSVDLRFRFLGAGTAEEGPPVPYVPPEAKGKQPAGAG
jgi:NTE family protein